MILIFYIYIKHTNLGTLLLIFFFLKNNPICWGYYLSKPCVHILTGGHLLWIGHSCIYKMTHIKVFLKNSPNTWYLRNCELLNCGALNRGFCPASLNEESLECIFRMLYSLINIIYLMPLPLYTGGLYCDVSEAVLSD